ncbi:hypothetical protein [Asticcacaulis solisilvae]|uniref:hypothetical protein n=1 Tax=Asticcacaulis solisilvae TaxID=1217274 RepID=UPI003FD83953
MKSAITVAGLMAATLLTAQVSLAADAMASDPEMKQIYDADQADRQGDVLDWSKLTVRDTGRRDRTGQLLAAGRLHTGADYVEAAYIFQHGATPGDFLMAHTLAVIAVKKGDSGGPWIAAASLDRYLQSVGQKQIYGTQSHASAGGKSREPFDRDLVSDALRRELKVADLATQDAQFPSAQAGAAQAGAASASPAPFTGHIQCDAGPVDKVFLKGTWHVYACDNGALVAWNDAASKGIIMVSVLGNKVAAAVVQAGDDAAEDSAAKAAFEAMTPAQVADLVAQARAVKPKS